MENKKIIFLDVGTHFAQEYKSMFGSNLNFLIRIIRQFIRYNLLQNGEKKISFKDLVMISKFRFYFNSIKKHCYHIFVEANPYIINREKIYKYANSIYNIAVTENAKAKLIKLYINRNNIYSEGNSIFANKQSIDLDQYILTYGIPSVEFCEKIKSYLDNKFEDYILILRINCEGMEENFIHAAIQTYSKKLKLITGSLKDVKEIKSLENYNDLMKMLEYQNIPFVEFTPSIPSWCEAHKNIKKIIFKFLN